jgi:hypothetical protein
MTSGALWLMLAASAMGGSAAAQVARDIECEIELPAAKARDADWDTAVYWQFAFEPLSLAEITCAGEAAPLNVAARDVPYYWVVLEEISVPAGGDVKICLRDAANECQGGAFRIGGARKLIAGPVLRGASGRLPIIDVVAEGAGAGRLRYAVRRILRARTSAELQGALAFQPQSETSSYDPIDILRADAFFGPFYQRLAEATAQLYWPPRAGLVAGQLNKGRTCSATLVGPKHILTNAHCLSVANCADVVVRFDRFAAADLDPARLGRCARVLIEGDRENIADRDFTLFELAAPPPAAPAPDGGQRARRWIDLRPETSLADTKDKKVLVAHHPLGDRMFGGDCYLRPGDTESLLAPLNPDPETVTGIVAHGCGTQKGSSGAMIALPEPPSGDSEGALTGVALHRAGHEIWVDDQSVIELWRQQALQPGNFAIDLGLIRERIVQCIEGTQPCK